MTIVRNIGIGFLGFLANMGEIFLFSFKAVVNIFTPPFYPKIIMAQIKEIGFYSLPVVGMTAIFTGAVLALQSYSGFGRFSSENSVAIVVVLSITRELGPVLAGLMVSGRIGAAVAAEIATMKVTEQIDALITLSTDPIKYLVSPRVLSSILVLPFLVIIADVIGILGGYLVSVYSLEFNSNTYLDNTFKYLEVMDVVQGLVKASFFGYIISSIGCFFGYNSGKGAQGVGLATTSAVVMSSILILLSNYILTQLFVK